MKNLKKVCFALVFCAILTMPVAAATILPTNVSKPGKGCTLVGVEGEYIREAKDALRLINSYRKEACKKGFPDPNQRARRLKPGDYQEIKWSSDLEYIARIRAAEAAVYTDHMRPSGKICFTLNAPNNNGSEGECLAWNYSKTMTEGIKQWYDEKSEWIKKKPTGVTGHYTAMINPHNKYVAISAFYSPYSQYANCTAGEFSGASSNMNGTRNGKTGACIQTIEVKKSLLRLNCKSKSKAIKAGETTSVKAILKANGCKVRPLKKIRWRSSNSNILKINSEGQVTGVDYGKATIKGEIGGLASAITINVTTHASGNSPAAPSRYAPYVLKGVKVNGKSKSFRVKWNKLSAAKRKKLNGYQIRYSVKPLSLIHI